MNTTELKEWLPERHQEERLARSAAAQAATKALETEATSNHGPGGTEGRYLSGCACNPCRHAAQHGTADRFHSDACRCASCIEAILDRAELERIAHSASAP